MEFLEFDLLLDKSGDTYEARVLDAPAGNALEQFEIPFKPLELENFYLRVGRTRKGVRRIDSPEMGLAKSIGARLFDAVFGSEVYACFLTSLASAKDQGKGLRFRLRVSAPELLDLPWEYLYNQRWNRFLALSVDTPIVRYLDLQTPVKPLQVSPPLKVLVVISSPQDFPSLDAEGEWARLNTALQPLVSSGLVQLERLDEATLPALQRQLRKDQYHILHYVGHGGFNPDSQEGVMIFEDESERGRAVSGQELGWVLFNHPQLRLAILNACEGARTSVSDPFAGVSQSLVQQGVDAVIAMQFEITDKASLAFSQEFYSALADGYSIDAALTEARLAIFSQGNDVEWGTPVFFTRSPDNRLFEVESAPEQVIGLHPGESTANAALTPVERPPAGVAELPASRGPETPGTSEKAVSAGWQDAARTLLENRRLLTALVAALLVVVASIVFFTNPPWGREQAQQQSETPATSEILQAPPEQVQPLQTEQTATPTRAPAGKPTLNTTPTALPTKIVDSSGATMVLVPAGFFLMGSNVRADEQPQRLVEVPQDFYIDAYEVTNEQYKECVADGACTPPTLIKSNSRDRYYGFPQYKDYPVIYVTWQDAQDFCAWRKARLPSEAEWEKAARSDDGRTFPWGENIDCSYANYNRCVGDTTEIGSYPKNVSHYGVYDMSGNVREWVEDWYKEYPDGNPSASGDFGETYRVTRGGAWENASGSLETHNRARYDPLQGNWDLGFRCASTPEGVFSSK